MSKSTISLLAVLLAALMVGGCGMRQPAAIATAAVQPPRGTRQAAPAAATSAPGGILTQEAPAGTAGMTASPRASLTAHLLYPTSTTEVEMGQIARFIVRLSDGQGNPVDGGRVRIAIRDPAGRVAAEVAAVPGSEGTYRAAWPVAHRQIEGVWQETVEADAGGAASQASGTFKVKYSTGEILLHKYGFWLDAPRLRDINPQLFGERGDAHNGAVVWGGQIPAQHVLPANWVVLNWRSGDFHLNTPEAARKFLLEEIGDLGFTPIREVWAFQPVRFKAWNAWQAGGRGQFGTDQVEWLAFYAPEVDKTYVIETTVVQPPAGSDPHARLRESFAVDPSVHADGSAPEPLIRLLPAPQLLDPPLGAQFTGLAQPVVLRWKPVRELGPDEYYEVAVDYNYKEANPRLVYTTRETQFALPEALYRTPSCNVFNWQVRLMRQTGTTARGEVEGQPVSYASLYWYLWWRYPAGEKAPFVPSCPNEQF